MARSRATATPPTERPTSSHMTHVAPIIANPVNLVWMSMTLSFRFRWEVAEEPDSRRRARRFPRRRADLRGCPAVRGEERATGVRTGVRGANEDGNEHEHEHVNEHVYVDVLVDVLVLVLVLETLRGDHAEGAVDPVDAAAHVAGDEVELHDQALGADVFCGGRLPVDGDVGVRPAVGRRDLREVVIERPRRRELRELQLLEGGRGRVAAEVDLAI